MGKKSLFASTVSDPPDKKPDETSANEPPKADPPSEPTMKKAEDSDISAAASSKKPNCGAGQQFTGPSADIPAVPASAGSALLSPLGLGLLCLGGLLLLITIASAINARRYIMVEEDGAVQIWKGQFSPNGKERLLILHGITGLKAGQSVYSRPEAYEFIRAAYLDKARDYLEASDAAAPGPQEFQRAHHALNQVVSFLPESLATQKADLLQEIRAELEQAAVFHDSGEKLALTLVEKKLKQVHHVLTGLLTSAGLATTPGDWRSPTDPSPAPH